MSPDAVMLAILTKLGTTWATCTPVAWPNRSFTPPQGPWIEPIIEMGDSAMGELGNDGVAIRFGVLSIYCSVLPDTGFKAPAEMAKRLENGFRRADADGVRFDDPATTPVGVVDGYYKLLMRVNFNAWIGE